MRLKYIVSLTATITISAYPAIAQETTKTLSKLQKTVAPVNQNILVQRTTNVNHRGDVHTFNNEGFSSLSPPCNSRICLFTLIRKLVKDSSQETEVLGGLVWQLGYSSQDAKAEADKLKAIAEKEKIDQESTLILTDKLAEAIESNKIERVKLYAISLAKKLGYADYKELLKEIINPINLFKY